MIIGKAIKNMVTPTWTQPELMSGGISLTLSGQTVSAKTALKIATYYRCLNTITDDLSMVPLQLYTKKSDKDIRRIMPDPFFWNMPYSVSLNANPFQESFKVFKKFWLSVLVTGNGYLWTPAGTHYLYALNPYLTHAEIREDGSLWYYTMLSNGKNQPIPAVEILHHMINPKNDVEGSGILEHARETVGTRQAGNATKSSMFKRGLMPSAVAEFDGEMNKEARQKIRDSYWEAVSGADQAGGVVVLDGKVKKFTLAEIKPADAQFLESLEGTDAEIANFYAFPLYKLNQGKQSYESNEQQDQDYMRSTLDSYLVPMEQESSNKWIPRREQVSNYWKYNRDAFLRMNSKARATYLKDKIHSAQYTPNMALAIDDLPGYVGGDVHFIASNMAVIKEDGSIEAISKPDTKDNGNQEEGS